MRPTASAAFHTVAKIFSTSTKKVGNQESNQESNQIFQVFPATFSLERIVVLPTRSGGRSL